MKPWMIGAALGLLVFSGTAVQAQDRNEAEAGPGFDFWGTGEGSNFYHRLSGDCETVDHRHGRNGAWGHWRLPLAAVVEDGPEEDERSGVVLRFRCLDGTECIQKGRSGNLTAKAGEHAIPFGNMERARTFARQVADLRMACNAGG